MKESVYYSLLSNSSVYLVFLLHKMCLGDFSLFPLWSVVNFRYGKINCK